MPLVSRSVLIVKISQLWSVPSLFYANLCKLGKIQTKLSLQQVVQISVWKQFWKLRNVYFQINTESLVYVLHINYLEV